MTITMVIIIVGICFGFAGIIAFLFWSWEYLENSQKDADSQDHLYDLVIAFIRTAEVLIIFWLLMRATGFCFGYLMPLAAFIGSIYLSYRADTSEDESDLIDYTIEKITLIAIGYISLIAISIIMI